MNIIQNSFQAIYHKLQFVSNKLLQAYTISLTWLRQLSRNHSWGQNTSAQNQKRYHLKDQTCVEFRLIGPQDRKRYLKGFKRISTKTNIHRFHTFKTGFTETELDYLLNIDNVHHLAIGAIDCKKKGIGIGLARYINQADKPDRAEAALTIIDEYQGRGLGTLLYRALMDEAFNNGIRTLNNVIMKDNRAMLHILEQMGAQQVSENEQAYELELHLSSPNSSPDLISTSGSSNKHHFQHNIKNASNMVI